jgi:DNA-binding HxlR family transcriptional regulator
MERELSVGAPLCACPRGPAACALPFCPYLHYAMELLGRRWTGSIVRALLSGIGRFSELRDVIPDLSDRMLSERLKELEAEGIVQRRVIPETPVRVEYSLTAKGRALAPILEATLAWTGEWMPHHSKP